MPRRSRIEQLDPRIREQVDRLVRAGRTIDEITEHLARLAGEEAPSRSAVGRYVRSAREQMRRYREAQEVAKVWVGRLEEDPEGDVGRLLSEMLRTVAFQTIGVMSERDGAEIGPDEIMLLARAIKDLASADKVAMERELKIRQEVARQAADAATKIAKRGGLSADAVQEIRREILGVAK